MAHRIDTPDAAPGGLWTGGDPQTGQPATSGSPEWFNDTVQEEICGFVESQGIPLDKERNDQLAEALDRLVYGRRYRPNEVLNGAFSVWQRGLSHTVTTAEAYTADRWFVRADGAAGAGSADVSRVAFSDGQTVVPGQPVHHLRLLQTAGSTVQSPRLGTRLENVRRFLGVKITIAFWAKTDVALQATLQVDRYFGTGGSAATNEHSETFQLDNTWQRYAFTVEVSGYSAETFGTDSFLEVRIDLAGGTTFQFDLADVVVKLGAYAAPFPRVQLFDEIEALQRYFEKSYALETAPGATTLNNVIAYRGDLVAATPNCEGLVTRYRAPKGATSVTWYSPSTGTADRVNTDGTPTTVTGNSRAGANTTGWPTLTGGTGTGVLVEAHFVCDSELYRT